MWEQMEDLAGIFKASWKKCAIWINNYHLTLVNSALSCFGVAGMTTGMGHGGTRQQLWQSLFATLIFALWQVTKVPLQNSRKKKNKTRNKPTNKPQNPKQPKHFNTENSFSSLQRNQFHNWIHFWHYNQGRDHKAFLPHSSLENYPEFQSQLSDRNRKKRV